MPESHDHGDIYQNNERSLTSLIRGINLAGGRRFALIMVRCNYGFLQEQIRQWLQERCSLEIPELVLSKSTQTLYKAIKTEFRNQQLPALSVSGLQDVANLDKLLLAANQVRDEFRKSFQFPIILWVTAQIQEKFLRLAPDFYSWVGVPIYFQPSSTELIAFLRQQSNQLFTKLLETNDRQLIENVQEWYRQHNSISRQEVESALGDLQHELEPDLEASLKFALGRDDYGNNKIEIAVEKYQQSLDFWQQINNLERQGILLFYLGLCYSRQAEIEQTQNDSNWQEAQRYFQQCLDAFTEAHRPDLKANFIGYLGEVLQYLEQWEELQNLVNESFYLHQIYDNTVELARDYSFLAVINLKHLKNAVEASQYAQQALQILARFSDNQQQDRGRYLLILAQAQQNLGQFENAISSLEQARENSYPHQGPRLYIQILEALRKLNFEQNKYREAFKFKLEQQAIESQYGFRAFIGAVHLRSQRNLNSTAEIQENIAQEISVSGRQQDVDCLSERIERSNCKLTILHGQLGVGKSSLIQAGLIPHLQQQSFEAREILPVLQRVYTNWVHQLGKQLREQIQDKTNQLIETPNSPTAIIEQLRENENRHLLTVLIFDQFEEFFFICNNRIERQAFFDFLSTCLDIPYLNIILSLREDYLHYLLDWERYGNLDRINDNILSNHHRYELGNFLPQDAKAIIQTLTARFQLTPEPELIEKMVQDLAGELAEIRPIELQVVGAQLQEQKIITLEEYQKLGDNPKDKLVQNYLEGVVRDCGQENESAARLVLYLLTGENNTRPPKTREELEVELKALEKDLIKEAEKLDLVLEIFQKSGLVFLIPEIPADRYQLVHDYLVSFIRQQQPKIAELVKELETNRKQLELTEERLRIAELEREVGEEQRKREIAEEQQRRVEVEIALEGREARHKLITSLIMLFVILVSLLAWGLYRQIRWVDQKSLDRQDKQEFALRINLAKAYLKTRTEPEVDLALIEMLKAGHILLLPEFYRQVEDEKIWKNFIWNMQIIISQVAKQKNTERNYKFYSTEDLDGLDSEELNIALEDLYNAGCNLVSPTVLNAVKEKHEGLSDLICEK